MSRPGDRAPKISTPREPTLSREAEGHVLPPKSVGVEGSISPGSTSSACAHQASAREPGGLDVAQPSVVLGEPAQEGDEPQAGAKIVEKSDEVIVPKKSAKARVTPVERAEGRTEAEGKSAARNAPSTLSEHDARTSLQRIRERTKQKPEEKWTNLLSHMRVPLMKEAYQRLRQDGAAGVERSAGLSTASV